MVNRLVSVDDSSKQFPTDVREVIAENYADTSTPEGAALAANFLGPLDQGQAFIAALDTGSPAALNLAIAGDSTGDAADEHVHRLAQMLAVRNPRTKVRLKQWNTATDAWFVTELVVSDGVGIQATYTATRRDTFHRTSADIIGTPTETGATNWTAGGGDAATDWTADGKSAVASADTLRAPALVSTGGVGSGRTKWRYQVVNGAAHTIEFLARRASASNMVKVSVAVDAFGRATPSLVKVVAGSTTVLDALRIADMPADGIFEVCVTVIVNSDGTALVGAEVNGQMMTAILSAADWTAVNAGFNQGIYVPSGTPTGDRWLLFEFGTWTAAGSPALSLQTLTIHNGSKPGSTLAYQLANFATLYPSATTFHALLVTSSHNYGTGTETDYLAAVDAFLTVFRAANPSAAVLLESQNQTYSPRSTSLQGAQIARCRALRGYAEQRRYGYIPVIEEWAGSSFVQADGFHPTNTGGGDGSQEWARSEYRYFSAFARSVRP